MKVLRTCRRDTIRNIETNNTDAAVSDLVDKLDPPLKPLVAEIRRAILESNDEITEHIKWNAPSFCFAGEDRVTFRLKLKGDGVQLIFHRGAKVKDASDFVFEDSSGLLEWVAKDRAILPLQTLEDAKSKTAAIILVVNEWFRATTEMPAS